MTVGEGCEGRVRGRMVESSHNVLKGGEDDVVGGGQGHGHFGGEPRDGVGDAFGPGVEHPHSVTPIGVECWANVPAVTCMWGPRGARGWLFVHEDTDAGWCNGRSVEVEVAVELCPGGEFWVEAGAAEEVEGKLGLREKAIPEVNWEVFVDAA